MTDTPNDDRRFSDEEFALILRKASELQEGGAKAPAQRTGMSLEEIKSIAVEAGIDPEKVAKAASLFARSDHPGTAATLLGGPSSYHLEHTAKGEISPEDMGRVLHVIRRATRRQGEGNQVLDAFEWRTTTDPSRIHVNVIPRDGETTIQIIGDRAGTGILTFLGSGLPWLIAAVALGEGLDVTSAAGVAGILAGAAGGAFLTFRTFWKSTTTSFRRKLTGLMEDLSTTVENSTHRDG
jgi:hypothetical protein